MSDNKKENSTEKESIIKMVEQHSSSQVNDFIKKNPDFDYGFTDYDGNNLLHHCVKRTSTYMLETLQILLNKGIDPKGVNAEFKTPIDVANQNDNISAVALLKFNISARNARNEKIVSGLEIDEDND